MRTPAGGGTSGGAGASGGTNDGLFEANPARTGTDGAAAGARESFKVNTEKAKSESNEQGKNDAADADLVIPARRPAATGTVNEGSNRPMTLPLDSRITSRAVSPRERQVIAVGFQKSVVASAKPVAPAKVPTLSKTAAPAKNWAGNTKSTDLAQHR